MTIESPVHAQGTQELIARLRASLDLSSRYLDTEAFVSLKSQIDLQIQTLEDSLSAYAESISASLPHNEWRVVSLSTEAPCTYQGNKRFRVETSVLTVPLREGARTISKPAEKAGLVFLGCKTRGERKRTSSARFLSIFLRGRFESTSFAPAN